MDKENIKENIILIEGRNAVMETLLSGRNVNRLTVVKESRDKKISAIIEEAEKHPKTKLDFVERKFLDNISKTKRHQGVIAWVSEFNYAQIDDILKKAVQKKEDPFIFILDGILDPHNLGDIIRTADLAGVHGIIIRNDRAVGLNATVLKSSAGALNYVLVAQVTNIGRTLDELKQKGLWIFCATMEGENIYRQNLKGPIALVIGSEGKGVSSLVKKKSDKKISIPMYGNINSLNASVAAGILAWEIVRQRRFI